MSDACRKAYERAFTGSNRTAATWAAFKANWKPEAESMRAYMEYVAADPKRAMAFLQDAGILDEHGELAKPYRSE